MADSEEDLQRVEVLAVVVDDGELAALAEDDGVGPDAPVPETWSAVEMAA